MFWPGESRELYSPCVAKSWTRLSDFHRPVKLPPRNQLKNARFCQGKLFEREREKKAIIQSLLQFIKERKIWHQKVRPELRLKGFWTDWALWSPTILPLFFSLGIINTLENLHQWTQWGLVSPHLRGAQWPEPESSGPASPSPLSPPEREPQLKQS